MRNSGESKTVRCSHGNVGHYPLRNTDRPHAPWFGYPKDWPTSIQSEQQLWVFGSPCCWMFGVPSFNPSPKSVNWGPSSCLQGCSPPARWGLLDFMSVACSSPPLLSSSCSTATLDAQCSLSDLNHDHPRPVRSGREHLAWILAVFPAGPQPRPSTPSVPCRTSTASIHAKCSLPDLM